MIRGDVSGAPTLEILDALIERGIELDSPVWGFSFEGNADHACAFTIELSKTGDDRSVRLLNTADDLEDPAARPFEATLRRDRDAVLSKAPQGPMIVVANNLLVSDSTLKCLGLTPCAAVLVKSERVSWSVVRPRKHALLDPSLSFSAPDARPYRAHLASIAKADADLAFGVATESEGWGSRLLENLYLIDMESAARIIPVTRRTLGDVTLAPVFPYDSPEGDMMRSLTERMNRLIARQAVDQP
jgi:hypothetical protein